MSDQPQADPQTPDPIADRFYSGAVNRIRRFMAFIAPVVIALCWWKYGVRAAGGLAFGCVIGYVNFYWLKRVISGFVDRAAGTQTTQSSDGIVFRFLMRYVLMAVGAYVILTVSPASLNGLLAGLFLPVAAIACEAVYELYVALTRGV